MKEKPATLQFRNSLRLPAGLSGYLAGVCLLLTACNSGLPGASSPPDAPIPITLTPLQPANTQTSRPTDTLTPVPTETATLTPEPSPTPTPTPVILVGAGDIAICGQEGDDQTAALLDNIPGVIFTAGDNSNEGGAAYQYQDCFDPSWGRHKDRIYPSAGNHDYMTPGAPDYYDYFGDAAGPPGQGYYSYNLGGWHIVVLNSNCNNLACGPDSEQVAWLRADLAANPARCTLAYWHHPRFSSGLAGGSGLYGFWDVLYQAGAEIVINGHDHNYERFAPQDPDGAPDSQRGIRQFIIGTGGASQRVQGTLTANSEVFNSGTYGVLKLILHPDSYDWEFIPVEGGGFSDAGSSPCHE